MQAGLPNKAIIRIVIIYQYIFDKQSYRKKAIAIVWISVRLTDAFSTNKNDELSPQKKVLILNVQSV